MPNQTDWLFRDWMGHPWRDGIASWHEIGQQHINAMSLQHLKKIAQ